MADIPLKYPPTVLKGPGPYGPGVTRIAGDTQPPPRTVTASAHAGVWPGDKRRPPDMPVTTSTAELAAQILRGG